MKGPSSDERAMVESIVDAYKQGAFPMADVPNSKRAREMAARAADDVSLDLPTAAQIGWYSPDPRSILPLEPGGLKVPSGLRRHVRKPGFTFTSDRCFERVIRACARPRASRAGEAENGLWIDESIARAYTVLHEHGYAHSIEAWKGEELVGGVYGVHIGAAFFAESMFCRPELGGTSASNLCLVQLVAHLRRRGFGLMDVQIANEHTVRFGVIDVARDEYLKRLALATGATAGWTPFESERTSEMVGLSGADARREEPDMGEVGGEGGKK